PADDLDGRLALGGAPGVGVDAEGSDVVAALRPEALVGVRVDALAVGAQRRGGDHAAPERELPPRAADLESLGPVGAGEEEIPGDERQRPEGPAAAAARLRAAAVTLPTRHVDLSAGGVQDVELPPVAQGEAYAAAAGTTPEYVDHAWAIDRLEAFG